MVMHHGEADVWYARSYELLIAIDWQRGWRLLKTPFNNHDLVSVMCLISLDLSICYKFAFWPWLNLMLMVWLAVSCANVRSSVWLLWITNQQKLSVFIVQRMAGDLRKPPFMREWVYNQHLWIKKGVWVLEVSLRSFIYVHQVARWL